MSELNDTPIAIVGIGCLLPGAHTPEEFWSALKAGADHRTDGDFGTGPDVPGGWGDDQHRVTALRGGNVTEPEIDLGGLRVAEAELAALGRVARWPIHVIRQALADAGVTELGRTGLVLGNYSFPTEESVARCLPLIHRAVDEGLRSGGLPVTATEEGSAPPATLWPSALPATVVGDAFGFGGPRLTLDAACASALYSMALARDYLATGQADVMIAGAVCAPDPLMIQLSFSDLRAYPANGVSQPFATDSEGIVTGQGAGVLVLKRLQDARRDGDRIHAVIRSIGLSNDGAGVHVLAPNVQGHLDAYAQAYKSLDRSTVDYIECHATGTPLGDSTELRGISEFFPQPPLLGSVKGNIGHLLTVAGFTSVLKVLLAMRHQEIPATPGIAESRSDRVVTTPRQWPRQRLAAVSSFGFGGTNAHAVLSTPDGVPAADEPRATHPMSVNGIGARLGPIRDTRDLDHHVRTATPALVDVPEERWDGMDEFVETTKGGYADTVDVDLRTYRMPPTDLRNMNPQHLLLFEAADQALTDAGIRKGDRRRIATVVAVEMEPRSHRHRARFDIGAYLRQRTSLAEPQLARLETAVREAMHDTLGANEVLSFIGSIMASRVAASRNLTGPTFTISADATAGARALEIAGLLLLDPTIEAVLVGGVELAGGVENTLARQELDQPKALGDGAAAIVVSRENAKYGTIDAISIRHGDNALAESFKDAGIDPSEVDYVELATPTDLTDLAHLYPGAGTRSALGSLTPLTGETQQASVLASLVKTLVCLHNAELPPAPEGLRAAALEDSGLYLPTEATPWLPERDRRVAAITATGTNSAAQILVSSDRARTDTCDWTGPLLLPIHGDNADELIAAAENLLHRDLQAAVRTHAPGTGRFTAVLVADDEPKLRKELEAAIRDLPHVIATGGEWTTPAGSYCTGAPLGPDERVAFVYPGAFTAYPGAGRELFRLFPKLRHEFEQDADLPRERFKHETLYPRSTFGPDRRALMRHESGMVEDIPRMLAIGTNFAVLHTKLLRDVLGIKPGGGFGYSLGESSMLFATGVWAANSRDDAVLTGSKLFQDELCGPKKLIREAWNTTEDEVWATRVLLTRADEVRDAIKTFDRLFLTHVNGPAEVVVAGDPRQCRELVERLGCPAVNAPANHVMHNPMVDPRHDELAKLNTYPLGTPDDLELLSAFDYDTVDTADQAKIAHNIACTLRGAIDFPRLVDTAYQRGFRYFVEVGPGATCTRWAKETLGDRPHLAVSIDRRGGSTGLALAQALAKLASHGLPVDLRVLFPAEPQAEPQFKHTVTCGGQSVVRRVRTAAARIAAELAPVAEALPVLTDDKIIIEGEPWVDPTFMRGAFMNPTFMKAPLMTPLRGLINSVADAHRAALSAHDAVQQAQLRLLEQDGPIWDEAALLEFATGKIANVFGPDFAVIDTYAARVRLPEPPYLFVSRVTRLQATPGEFKPSSITTEYDIPHDAWYAVDGLAPCAVTIEAGQCDLLLISYLGIDFRNRGERVYRLLDSSLVFHGDLPRAGQTVRYDINIDRFVWNGDSLLFFFNYKCYADGELILELLDACAGFFSAAELDNSLGIVPKPGKAVSRTWFTPLERTTRTSLGAHDLQLLSEGRLAEVFGPAWDQTKDGCNPSIRLPGEMLRMVDEVTEIDRLGGPRGLGFLRATKKLVPDAWYFRSHFTGDPVLAGSLVAEGAVQLLQAYAMYLGLHLVLPDAEFQPVRGQVTQVKVRGQITPKTAEIRYAVEITEITMLPRPTVVADITVYVGDKAMITMRDFGLQIREKPGTPFRAGPGGVAPFLGRRNHDGEVAFLNELHMAHAAKGDLGIAMGPEFDVYANRRAPYIPNGDFRFVDRIMALNGTRGELKPGAHMVTEYDVPPEAWYFRPGYEGMPNCVYLESSLQAAILLGYYLGATLDTPDEELSIRNLDGTATVVKDVDLRGRTIRHSSTMLSSQAVPGAVLQKFRYELSADGEVFYRGESLFGYFSEQALATQLGLDSGKLTHHWLDTQTGLEIRSIQPSHVDEHFKLIDSMDVTTGGRFGLGYARGRRRIRPEEWYFDCHFHRDPVMPGSLGVEAVLQAMEIIAADGMTNPVFSTPVDVPTAWRYRGQILRTDHEMSFELHVKSIERDGGKVRLIADAGIWKHDGSGGPGLRIYELTDLAVDVREEATR